MQADGKPISNKPRLLIILNRFVIGGQAVDTIPLAWHLRDDFNILILYGEKEKDETEPQFLLEQFPGLRLKKLKYLRRSINPFIDILAFSGILINILRFKADIVHTHGAKSGFIGRISAWLCAVPVVIHTFHGHLFHSYFSRKVSGFIALAEKTVGRITTAVIALSETQKRELSEEFSILPASKIFIISLGFAFYNSAESSVLRETFRSRYNLQPSDVAIGIIGRIVPVKNHTFFTEVVHRILLLHPKNPPAFFVIGDGELRTQTEEELSANNIPFSSENISQQTRVVFTSWLTDMYEVMNGLDIVILTSLNEGTPLSIIEAQFFKRPVVATNVGGVRDTMQNGIAGFLSEKTDIKTFCEKLCLLVDDEELRTSMGEQGSKFAKNKFSKQKEVASTKELYFDLLLQKGYSL